MDRRAGRFAYEWIIISAGEITMEQLKLRLSLVPSWPSRTVEATTSRYAGVWGGAEGLRARLDRFTDREALSFGWGNAMADSGSSTAASGEDISSEEA